MSSRPHRRGSRRNVFGGRARVRTSDAFHFIYGRTTGDIANLVAIFHDGSHREVPSKSPNFALVYDEAGGRDEGGAVGTVICDAEVAGEIPHV